MEKKSTSAASSSAIMTDAGVSIMTPIWILSLKSVCSPRSSLLASSRIRLASRTSCTEVIMGSIMAMLPYAEARNNARNWTLKISGRVRQMRIAR